MGVQVLEGSRVGVQVLLAHLLPSHGCPPTFMRFHDDLKKVAHVLTKICRLAAHSSKALVCCIALHKLDACTHSVVLQHEPRFVQQSASLSQIQ